MMKRSVLGAAFGALVVLGGLPAAAHTHTPWQMHQGLEVTAANPLGLMAFSCTPSKPGDSCEYSRATIPPEGDVGWTFAPDENGIELGMDSRVCQAPVTCHAYGDFTYFQTYVNVAAGPVVSPFTLSFTKVDDGVRVTIFNSQHPQGVTAPASYLYNDGVLSTGNLAALLKAGERNRVVLTHVDDCCWHSYLLGAALHLDGEVVGLGCEGDSSCDDGNACTADLCTSAGTCSHLMRACSNGQSCTVPNPNLTSGGANTLACTPSSDGQPTLVAHGNLEMTLECGQDVWVDPGAQAWDGACSPLTVHTYNSGNDASGPGPNTCVEGTYSVQYLAWDASWRTVSAIRSVKVDDTTPPTFQLKGDAHLTLQCGQNYVEPGWEAWDACYGNIAPEVEVFGYPNCWAAGRYEVTYKLKDSGGNSAPTQTRTVDVVNCPW